MSMTNPRRRRLSAAFCLPGLLLLTLSVGQARADDLPVDAPRTTPVVPVVEDARKTDTAARPAPAPTPAARPPNPPRWLGPAQRAETRHASPATSAAAMSTTATVVAAPPPPPARPTAATAFGSGDPVIQIATPGYLSQPPAVVVGPPKTGPSAAALPASTPATASAPPANAVAKAPKAPASPGVELAVDAALPGIKPAAPAPPSDAPLKSPPASPESLTPPLTTRAPEPPPALAQRRPPVQTPLVAAIKPQDPPPQPAVTPAPKPAVVPAAPTTLTPPAATGVATLAPGVPTSQPGTESAADVRGQGGLRPADSASASSSLPVAPAPRLAAVQTGEQKTAATSARVDALAGLPLPNLPLLAANDPSPMAVERPAESAAVAATTPGVGADNGRGAALAEVQTARERSGLNATQLARIEEARQMIDAGAGAAALERMIALNAELDAAVSLYRVSSGDSLASIAGLADIYGNPRLWPLLWQANVNQLGQPPRPATDQALRVPSHPRVAQLTQALDYAGAHPEEGAARAP